MSRFAGQSIFAIALFAFSLSVQACGYVSVDGDTSWFRFDDPYDVALLLLMGSGICAVMIGLFKRPAN